MTVLLAHDFHTLMRFTCITLLFLLPLLCPGQDRAILGFSGSLDYVHRTLSENVGVGGIAEVVALRNKQESGNFGGTAKLTYARRLGERMYLSVGAGLFSLRFRGRKLDGLTWGSEHDGNGGWIDDPSTPNWLRLYHTHRFVQLPVALRREFGTGHLRPFVEIGLVPAYHLASRTRTVTDVANFVTSDQRGYGPRFQLFGEASVGVAYAFSTRWRLLVQPLLRYQITNFTTNYPDVISEHLYSAGLLLGVRRAI